MYLACFTVNISEINVCGIKTKSNSQSLSVVHYQAVDLGTSLMTIDEHYIESDRMSSAVAVKTQPARFKAAAPGQADFLN